MPRLQPKLGLSMAAVSDAAYRTFVTLILRLPPILLLLAAAAPLPSASTPATGTSTLRDADARVAQVAYRLAAAGDPLCADAYPLTGLQFHHLAEYLPQDRPLMIERHRLDRGPGVLTVLAGSPAASAGLLAGDVLIAVNARPFESGASIAAEPKRKRWRERIEASEAQLEAELRKGPAELLVLRQGQEIRLTLGSRPACTGRVRLAYSDQVNAFADARRAIVTTAMLDFVRSDDELALILGHEMAHLILKHPPMGDGDKVLASIGIRSGTFWKREEAADRLAIRLVAAAGYDLAAVIPFWRRFLSAYDSAPQIFRYHPSLRARERIAQEEIEQLRSGPKSP
jgi:Zn-dependent protease with chaperone function